MKTRYTTAAEFLADFNKLVAERAQPATTSTVPIARKNITGTTPQPLRPALPLQHTPPVKIRRTI